MYPSYDLKCKELAEYFMYEIKGHTEDETHTLVAAIQAVIEIHCDYAETRIKESLSVTKEPEMEQVVQSSTKATTATKSQ